MPHLCGIKSTTFLIQGRNGSPGFVVLSFHEEGVGIIPHHLSVFVSRSDLLDLHGRMCR